MKLKFLNIITKKKSKLLAFTDQAVVSGGNFFVCILLARSLGLEAFGEFTLTWLIVLFASSIHQAWIITPMYTFSPKLEGASKDQYLKIVNIHQFLYAAGATLMAICFCSISSQFIPEWETAASSYVPATVFAYLMYDYCRKLSYAKHSVQTSLIIDLITYSIQFAGLLSLSVTSLLSIGSTFLVLSISFIAPCIVMSKSLMFKWDNGAILDIARKHWTFSKWLIGTSLLQWISGNFFIIVAGGLLNPAAVGAIRILQNIIGILHVLFLAIENFVPISAVRILHVEGISAMGSYLKNITIKGGILTLVISLVIAAFGEKIITLLYGKEHAEFAYLLYGFAILYVLVFIGMTFRFAIRSLELTRSIFLAYIFSALFSLLSAKFIIENFGIEGILLGFIITQLIMQTIFIYSLRNKMHVLWKSST